MCTQYNGNISDLIIIPISPYYLNLCTSYDRTSLVLMTFTRLCIFICMIIYLSPNKLEYVDNFLVGIVIINALSLFIALCKVPVN
jgi:hypothetical protein